MSPKNFALFGGILMLLMGVVSLVPNMVGSTENLPPLMVQTSYGLFLGLFAMNIFNKVALIAFGLAGIWAASARFTDLPASIHFSRWVCYLMGALAILGLIPQTNTLFGYMPLFGNVIWEHAIFAVVGGIYGFYLTARVPNVPDKPKVKFQKPAHGTR